MNDFENKIINIITAIVMLLIITVIIGCIGTFFYWLWTVLF